MDIKGILFTFLLSQAAFAGLGKVLPKAELPSNLCLISIQQSRGIHTEVCSGFLVSKNQILTAAHCTEKLNSKSYVTCSGSEQSIKISSLMLEKNVDLENMENDPQKRSYDSALLKLEKSVASLNQFGLIKTKEEARFLVSSSERCAFFGFSHKLGKSIANGISPKGIFVHPKSLSFKNDLLVVDGRLFNVSLVQAGDSGGGIACKPSRSSIWYFVGVVSGRDWDYQSFFAPSYMAKNLPLLNIQPLKVEYSDQISEVDNHLEVISSVMGVKPFSEIVRTENTKITSLQSAERLEAWPANWSTIDHKFTKVHIKRVVDDHVEGTLELLDSSQNFLCLYGFICEVTKLENVRVKKSDLVEF